MKENVKNSFKVASYNVLASCYEKKTTNIVPRYLVNFENRSPLLQTSFANFNSDFIILQEIDNYLEFYQPSLNYLGYESIYKQRPGAQDGLLIAWKNEDWNLLSTLELSYNDHPEAQADKTYRKGNIGLFGLFSKREREIIIGNTHIHWNSRLDFVELSQARIFRQTMDSLRESNRCPVVVGGDFNSFPNSPVVQHLLEEYRSAYENWGENGHPPFTNYGMKFRGCLDYLFYSHDLEVTYLLDIPVEETEKIGYLPNENQPSDHLPILAEFTYL